MTNLLSSAIQWSLIGFHYLTETVQRGYELLTKTVKGIQDAHSDEVWIFLDPNCIPYCIKGTEWKGKTTSVYYPATHAFYRHTGEVFEGRMRQFDVVIAEIVKEDGSKKCCSELFHNVSWAPGATPSLFEMLLLDGLHSDRPYTTDEIYKWKLSIMDSNGDEYEIKMDSEKVMEAFTRWDFYKE
jgi:hypothetical protein